MLRAALLLPILATPASATCITPDDLARGIRVLFENSDWTELRPLGEDRVHSEEYYAAFGYGQRWTGRFGVYYLGGNSYVVQRQDTPGCDVSAVYPVPESDLPEPVAGDAGWLGLVTTASEDEKGAPAERVHRRSFSFLHAAPISVSGCTYDVVGVEEVTEYDVHATEPGDRRTTLAYYLPALRAGFIVAARTDGGTWVFSEPVSIEPLGAP